MNLKIIVPETWQKDDFNKWITKITEQTIKNKYE